MKNTTLITVNPRFEWDDISQRYVLVGHDGQYQTEAVMRFDRAAQKNAKNALNTEDSTANSFGSAATGIGAPLTTQLQQQATNPTGFNPSDINSMLVSGEEGAGGATGDLASDASLAAARSRNTGSTSGVLDALQRQKTQALGSNALAVNNANAQLKQSKQADAQHALSGLYGTDVSGQLSAMGMAPGTIGTEVSAGNSGWLQNTLNTINTLTGAAKNVSGAAYGQNSGFANQPQGG